MRTLGAKSGGGTGVCGNRRHAEYRRGAGSTGGGDTKGHRAAVYGVQQGWVCGGVHGVVLCVVRGQEMGAAAAALDWVACWVQAVAGGGPVSLGGIIGKRIQTMLQKWWGRGGPGKLATQNGTTARGGVPRRAGARAIRQDAAAAAAVGGGSAPGCSMQSAHPRLRRKETECGWVGARRGMQGRIKGWCAWAPGSDGRRAGGREAGKGGLS